MAEVSQRGSSGLGSLGAKFPLVFGPSKTAWGGALTCPFPKASSEPLEGLLPPLCALAQMGEILAGE